MKKSERILRGEFSGENLLRKKKRWRREAKKGEGRGQVERPRGGDSGS